MKTNYFNRIVLMAKRSLFAISMGIYFPGTKRFKLPSRLFIQKREIKIVAPQEPSLAWDFINVLLDDEYGLREITPQPRTIIDIGANIGLFSLWARSCFQLATVHAYEPNPQITQFTRKNLEQCDVTLFTEAVGSEMGFASMIDGSESRLGQFAIRESGEIVAVTLEEAINRIGGSVDLLKLDCEGAEWEIFLNPKPFKNVKSIRMEYHLTEGRTISDVKKVASDLGFTVARLEENSGFGIVWLSRP